MELSPEDRIAEHKQKSRWMNLYGRNYKVLQYWYKGLRWVYCLEVKPSLITGGFLGLFDFQKVAKGAWFNICIGCVVKELIIKNIGFIQHINIALRVVIGILQGINRVKLLTHLCLTKTNIGKIMKKYFWVLVWWVIWAMEYENLHPLIN